MSIKGIILAGGSGTRLFPITTVTSKHLLPIYDKPMIFYPLSTLMLAGIKDILIISTPQDTNRYKKLLGDGSDLGINLQYAIQDSPRGIAEAFIVGEDFIGNSPSMLILGDNIFYGNELQSILKGAIQTLKGATIFAHLVKDPKRYGIVNFNNEGEIISIEEKPVNPKSKYAVVGMYLFDKEIIKIAKDIEPSNRGEFEITSVNNVYLKNKRLAVEFFGRGMTWIDAGTTDSLMEASEFVSIIQKRQGLLIGSPEEVSWRNGWINSNKLQKLASFYNNSEYSLYLHSLVKH